MSRRPSPLLTVLVIVAVGLVSALAATVLDSRTAWHHAAVDTTGEVDFDRPLVVPPLDTGTLDAGAGGVFDLRAQEGQHGSRWRSTLSHGASTAPTSAPLCGPNAAIRCSVNVTNDLTATSVHWHGMHLPAPDGRRAPPAGSPGPDLVADLAGGPAGRHLWYHPHPHGETADHVSRGLAGMVILGTTKRPASACREPTASTTCRPSSRTRTCAEMVGWAPARAGPWSSTARPAPTSTSAPAGPAPPAERLHHESDELPPRQ